MLVPTLRSNFPPFPCNGAINTYFHKANICIVSSIVTRKLSNATKFLKEIFSREKFSFCVVNGSGKFVYELFDFSTCRCQFPIDL